jgi:hypothetical protein
MDYYFDVIDQPFFQPFLSYEIKILIYPYQIRQLDIAISKIPIVWRGNNHKRLLEQQRYKTNRLFESLPPPPTPILINKLSSIDQMRIKLLRWIVNYQISLYSLYFTQSDRNYNTVIQEWLAKRPEGSMTKEEYNAMNLETQRPITEEIKFNDYNLFLHVKKTYLKTDECKYEFVETTPEEKQAFIQQINRRSRSRNVENQNNSEKIPYEVISSRDLLGIRKLSFLQSLKNKMGNNIINIEISSTLYDLVNLYLTPVTQKMNDIRYTYNDYILMCITYLLFQNDRLIELTGKKGQSGFMSITTTNLNKMKLSKYEDLRFSRKTKEGSAIPQYRGYPAQSYMPAMFLLGYMIQHYLYHLNPNYVPNIHDLQFDFGSTGENPELKSMTYMNLASQRNPNGRLRYRYSGDLSQILILGIEPIISNSSGAGAGGQSLNSTIFLYENPNYIPFLLKILIKLCDILIEYQHKCYFVHRDLHTKNIMVNFNLLANGYINIDDFEVKLIDLTLSSIVIQNEIGELSILGYTNRRPIHNLDICNPYVNNDWKLVDLRYFFITLITSRLYNNERDNSFVEQNIQVKNFLYIILSIFEIPFDCFNRHLEYLDNKSIKKCYNEWSIDFRNLLIDQNAIKYVFGERYNQNYYDPSILKNKIQEILNR